jgi:hypothetical protein
VLPFLSLPVERTKKPVCFGARPASVYCFELPLPARNSKKKLTSLLPKEEAGNHLHKKALCGIQNMLHKSILKIPTPLPIVKYHS